MNPDTPQRTFELRGKTLDLGQPKVMGVLNLTPDSFSDGGQFFSVEAAIKRVSEMAEEGADIIDVGGESTRPGSDPVSEEEELSRVIPVLKKLVPAFPSLFFSIDTTKYEVARQALSLGVHLVNDVSGLEKEPRFVKLCGTFDAGYILMHSKGDPKTMQESPHYDNLFDEIDHYFSERIERLLRGGCERIILDPGIGFGKTLQHNLQIVGGLDKFKRYGLPVLAGASRKSMIGQILNNRSTDGRLAGTLAIHYHCLMKGATFLRVHDVREARDSIQIYNAVLAAQSEPPKPPLD